LHLPNNPKSCAAFISAMAGNFSDDGLWGAGLDVADGGGDLNALAVRKGPVLKFCRECGASATLGLLLGVL
jgi:hypothetical protein